MSDYVLATVANERFAGGLRVLVESIRRCWRSREPFELVVLDAGLSPGTVARTRALVERVRFVDLLAHIPGDLPIAQSRLEAASYGWLWAPELVDAADTLCVDADFLFALDPREVFERGRAASAPLAAVRDPMLSTLGHDCPWSEATPEDLDLPYFNAGLVYLDLRDPAVKELGPRSLELVRSATSPPAYHDQTVANYLFRGRWAALPERYNDIDTSNRALRSWCFDRNLHFVGPGKPWEDVHRHRDIARNLIFRTIAAGEVPPLGPHVLRHWGTLEHLRFHWRRLNARIHRRWRLERQRRDTIGLGELRTLASRLEQDRAEREPGAVEAAS